jgi:polygalacturonase
MLTPIQVIFKGITTFGYAEWSGPCVHLSGSFITVESARGAVLDGEGARWWDGQGSNGGKIKPNFLGLYGLTSSTIRGITVRNTPAEAFSISQSNNLTLADITIDDSAGDTQGAHNTDGFDIGLSTDITILGAVVKNQDDCLAINSGQARVPRFHSRYSALFMPPNSNSLTVQPNRIFASSTGPVREGTVSPLPSAATVTTPRRTLKLRIQRYWTP